MQESLKEASYRKPATSRRKYTARNQSALERLRIVALMQCAASTKPMPFISALPTASAVGFLYAASTRLDYNIISLDSSPELAYTYIRERSLRDFCVGMSLSIIRAISEMVASPRNSGIKLEVPILLYFFKKSYTDILARFNAGW